MTTPYSSTSLTSPLYKQISASWSRNMYAQKWFQTDCWFWQLWYTCLSKVIFWSICHNMFQFRLVHPSCRITLPFFALNASCQVRDQFCSSFKSSWRVCHGHLSVICEHFDGSLYHFRHAVDIYYEQCWSHNASLLNATDDSLPQDDSAPFAHTLCFLLVRKYPSH